MKSVAHAQVRCWVLAAKNGELDDREERLKRWREFEAAYTMHPENGGEHFMPLIVCAGAAGDGEKGRSYTDKYLGVDILTYYWGSEVDV